MRKEVHKTYNRAFMPPPRVSAKSFVVYEMNSSMVQSGKILVTQNGKNSQ